MKFASTKEVVTKLTTVLATTAPGVEVRFGKRHTARRDVDPTSGRVVVVPTDANFRLPEIRDHAAKRIPWLSKQRLEIHCWARAPKNVDPAEQYADDFTQAEILRGLVLAALGKYVDGVNEGGTGPIVETGENTWGVELVLDVSVDVDTGSSALLLAPDDSVFETDGEFESAAGNLTTGTCS